MSFSAPKAPDPTATSNTQQQFNVQAAGDQNKINSYNQSNAFGSQNYVQDASSPSGYRLNTSLSAPLQSIFNTQTGTVNDLANNSAGMYSRPYDLNAASAATAKNLNSWQQQYLQPIFDQQASNTEAQLRNQGLMPGTEAYDNAKNLLARNQGDITNQYLTNNQGQAFGQALQAYQTPLQTIAGLQQTIPGNPQFANTPTSQIQPANYQGAVQSNYQNQLQNYENTWNNIGKLGTAAVGLAAAPLTGGTSLAASIPGMFNSATNGMFQSNPYGSMPRIGGGWG
jgi:hypothetical protein